MDDYLENFPLHGPDPPEGFSEWQRNPAHRPRLPHTAGGSGRGLSWGVSNRARAVLPALAALAIYAAGAARTILWADSSKLTLYALGPYAPSLNPGDHPGWSLLAWLWLHAVPVPPVMACHLFSAVMGALAVGLAAVALARAGYPPEGAFLLLAALPVWWAASVTETYTTAIAAVLAVLLLASGRGHRQTFLAGLAAGFGATVHAMTVPLTAPILAAIPRRHWPAGIAGGLLGMAPVWLALRGVAPDPLTGHLAGRASSWTWHLNLFVDTGRIVPGTALVAGLLLLALGPLGLTSMARGGTRRLHPWPAGGWAAIAALGLLLATYSPSRLHLMTGFLVLGLFLVLPPRMDGRHALAHVGFQAVLYFALPLLLIGAGFGSLGARQLPHRDNATYFLRPWKAGERGTDRYVRELLDAAPRGAVILADFNPGAPLVLWQRLHHTRPDVRIVPTAVDEAVGSPDPVAALARRIENASPAPVVLADGWEPYYHLAGLRSRFGFRIGPCGPGWQIFRAAGARSSPVDE